jgi:molecular chaperone GrpE
MREIVVIRGHSRITLTGGAMDMGKDVLEPVEGLSVSDLNSSSGKATADLERLEHELEATRDQLLRALADFDNYRRRIEREAESIGQAGRRDLILGLLEVLDSFDKALAMSSNDSHEFEGLEAIRRQLLKVLESSGVSSFESLGELFDPEWHEAINAVDAQESGVEPGTIVQEFQKGYSIAGRLLRPARVQVAQ